MIDSPLPLRHAAIRTSYGYKGGTMQKLTISRLADSVGTNLETVRYYERIGLMPEPGRTRGGHRAYAASHI